MNSSELKPIIRDARFIKEYANIVNKRLGGRTGRELDQILTRAEVVCNTIYVDHVEWTDNKRDILKSSLKTDVQFAGKSDVGLNSLLEDSFIEGFNLFLKHQYRLYRKEEPQSVNKLQTDEYLARQAKGFFFDFFRTFRVAERTGASPAIALQIATLAYRHKPDTLTKVIQKYPDVRSSGIYQAVIGNPADTEGWLNSIKIKAAEMRERHPDLEESTILRAVFTYPQGYERFIENFKIQFVKLKDEFPQLPTYVCKEAVMYYSKDARGFLQSVTKLLPQLRVQFPKVAEYILVIAASAYNKRAAKYVTEFLKKQPELKSKYPDLPDYAIASALIHRTANPEIYLDKVQSTLCTLRNRYPQLSTSLATRVALDNVDSNDAVRKVKNAFAVLPEYLKRFPGFTESDILYVLLKNSADAEKFLQQTTSKAEAYKRENPSVPPNLVTYAYVNQSEPIAFIKDTIKKHKELQVAYSDIASSLLLAVATYHHPDNCCTFIDTQIARVPEYQTRFPSVSTKRIISALLRYPQNPDNYIKKILK